MLNKIFTTGLILTLLLIGQPARAQTPGLSREAASWGDEAPAVEAFMTQSQRRGASPEFVQEVLDDARKMREQNLPVGPYLNKASEGLAKGVQPDRIRPALSQTRKQTQTANDLVERAVSRGAVVRSPQERKDATLRMQRAMLNQISPRALERLSDSMVAKHPGKVDVDQIGRAASELSQKQYSNRPKDSGKTGWWGVWQAEEGQKFKKGKEKGRERDRVKDHEDKDRDRGRDRDQKKDQEKWKGKDSPDRDKVPGSKGRDSSSSNGEKKDKEWGSKGNFQNEGSKRKSGESSFQDGRGPSGKGGTSGFGGSGKGKGKK